MKKQYKVAFICGVLFVLPFVLINLVSLYQISAQFNSVNSKVRAANPECENGANEVTAKFEIYGISPANVKETLDDKLSKISQYAVYNKINGFRLSNSNFNIEETDNTTDDNGNVINGSYLGNGDYIYKLSTPEDSSKFTSFLGSIGVKANISTRYNSQINCPPR